MVAALALITVVQAPKPPTLPPLKRVPGTIQGRCVTMGGAPLEDVQVVISGATQAGENVQYSVASDARGRYAVKLPAGNYRVGRANWSTPAPKGNVPYWLPLRPIDGKNDDEPGAKGIIEDLVLPMSGKMKPNSDPTNINSYYGGSFGVAEGRRVKKDWLERDRWSWPEGAKIELTLTPASKLLDGREAKPLTVTVEREGGSGYVYDVPLATYTVAATLVLEDGARRPLKVGVPTYFGGYSPTVRSEPEAGKFTATAALWFPAKSTDSTPLLNGTGVAGTTVYVVEEGS